MATLVKAVQGGSGMTDQLSDPPGDRDEEAAGWCMALSERALTKTEHDEFEQWLADPANAAALQDQAILWDFTEAAANHPAMIKARSRALDDYRQANAVQWRSDGANWRRRGVIAGLASVAAALLLVFTTILPGGDDATRFSTGIGERRIAMLEDGSRLTLDADSQVDVRMTPERRILTMLRGRAKFDVAKDPLRPFSSRPRTTRSSPSAPASASRSSAMRCLWSSTKERSPSCTARPARAPGRRRC